MLICSPFMGILLGLSAFSVICSSAKVMIIAQQHDDSLEDYWRAKRGSDLLSDFWRAKRMHQESSNLADIWKAKRIHSKSPSLSDIWKAERSQSENASPSSHKWSAKRFQSGSSSLSDIWRAKRFQQKSSSLSDIWRAKKSKSEVAGSSNIWSAKRFQPRTSSLSDIWRAKRFQPQRASLSDIWRTKKIQPERTSLSAFNEYESSYERLRHFVETNSWRLNKRNNQVFKMMAADSVLRQLEYHAHLEDKLVELLRKRPEFEIEKTNENRLPELLDENSWYGRDMYYIETEKQPGNPEMRLQHDQASDLKTLEALGYWVKLGRHPEVQLQWKLMKQKLKPDAPSASLNSQKLRKLVLKSLIEALREGIEIDIMPDHV